MKLSINYYLTIISLFFLILLSTSITYCNKSNNSKTETEKLTDLMANKETTVVKSENSVKATTDKAATTKDKKSKKGKKGKKGKKTKDSKEASDIVTYKRIVSYIHEYALVATARSDVNKKKRISGALDPNYPKALRMKARKMHFNKKIWNKLMLYPAKVYKFCIYPFYDLNYVKWCEEKYNEPKKQINCQATFCAVCCDNLQIMFRNQADGDVLGDLLLLSKASGYAKIQQTATKSEIHECRRECKAHYPVQFPGPKLPVPRDPVLGKFSNTPATSCSDIKRWGDIKAENGTYWIKLHKKGTTQVYCDMHAMLGGWTLFFNYMKFPNKKVKLSKGKIPATLKDNSHIDLKDGGFNENQVKELRFFCTEKSDKKYFWHWRTDSPSTIRTAFSGDQSKMNLKEFKDEYSEMVFPGKALLWTRAIGQQEMEEQWDYLGKSKNGGFWDTPFAVTSLKKYWVVRGHKKEEEWMCGTNHTNQTENDSAYTHHTVFFRGDAPDEDFARARYYNKEIMKLRKLKIAALRKQHQ